MSPQKLANDYNFNSIKVRLKRIVYNSSLETVLNFNSIKVRLKQFIKVVRMFEELYFNSIKVRLKRLQKVVVFYTFIFQFHKGTIKTERDRLGVIPE